MINDDGTNKPALLMEVGILSVLSPGTFAVMITSRDFESEFLFVSTLASKPAGREEQSAAETISNLNKI